MYSEYYYTIFTNKIMSGNAVLQILKSRLQTSEIINEAYLITNNYSADLLNIICFIAYVFIVYSYLTIDIKL